MLFSLITNATVRYMYMYMHSQVQPPVVSSDEKMLIIDSHPDGYLHIVQVTTNVRVCASSKNH